MVVVKDATVIFKTGSFENIDSVVISNVSKAVQD